MQDSWFEEAFAMDFHKRVAIQLMATAVLHKPAICPDERTKNAEVSSPPREMRSNQNDF